MKNLFTFYFGEKILTESYFITSCVYKQLCKSLCICRTIDKDEAQICYHDINSRKCAAKEKIINEYKIIRRGKNIKLYVNLET